MPDSKPTVRRTVPKVLAAIDADVCTGCGACVEICPADCIAPVTAPDGAGTVIPWCEVDWDRCIGCGWCVRIPTRKANRHRLLVCPWEAIEMVPRDALVDHVDRLGGPATYRSVHRRRLIESAGRQRAEAT